YILETSAYPREHEQLKELKEATIQKFKERSLMSIPADEGQFISMMLKVLNAKKTLEVGVFTGYSVLVTALALPEDGKVVAIDPDREAYEIGLPFIEKAGVAHKIQFLNSDGIPVLNNLLDNGEEGSFDFAFVDADKENYINYHELVLKLVKVGGIIAYDNTLWFGTVAMTEEDLMGLGPKRAENYRPIMVCLKDFNSFLVADSRIELAHLSIGDGISICRRIK
ncbi:caffeoyl-CoA 3-O-methyltransferase, partial [Perilla frutescens var. frutescens]